MADVLAPPKAYGLMDDFYTDGRKHTSAQNVKVQFFADSFMNRSVTMPPYLYHPNMSHIQPMFHEYLSRSRSHSQKWGCYSSDSYVFTPEKKSKRRNSKHRYIVHESGPYANAKKNNIVSSDN